MLSRISPGGGKRLEKEEGFTLVEILIATVILATVLTIAYGVFSSSYSALHQVNPEKDISYTAQVILDRMADEIQSAYYRPDLAYTGFVGENTEKEEAPRDSLTFSAMANFSWIRSVEGIRQSDFLRISYALVEDEEEEGGILLIRRQDPTFRPFEDDSEEIGSGARGVHQLADNVWGIDFRYFDGREWLEAWASDERDGLPRAVEIKLILRENGGKRIPFYAVIPVGSS